VCRESVEERKRASESISEEIYSSTTPSPSRFSIRLLSSLDEGEKKKESHDGTKNDLSGYFWFLLLFVGEEKRRS
jgi:hypothetical protein